MHTTGDLVADAGAVTVIDATPVTVNDTCPDCGICGTRSDHVARRLVGLPVVGFPTRLRIRVPRFTCNNDSCRRTIFQVSLAYADDEAKLTRRVTRWILQRLAINRMSVSATAKALRIRWQLVNTIAVQARAATLSMTP